MESKYTGIWMDHASAHLMELAVDSIESKTIVSKFTHEEKKETMHRGEKTMHNKEQHEEQAYYNEIAAAILNCKEVLLFGATKAKDELHNILKADHRFDQIKIKVKQVDKLKENQQYAFVKEYFLKHLSAVG